ncbi:integral membrane transport protein [Streptomyces collinus Tu 365]|uniref:Integral membrane transport protein n=1 Tax=Streptomyces collinus (strain DSM 40733 / Tue 365) TaxID=1214242 RepID=S5VQT5_STRC3|nr:integral membrane transport protein [Streptomyces collinus Tu 365]
MESAEYAEGRGARGDAGSRARARARAVRAVAAGSVGNLVEWYEFGVYGFLATVLADRFFTPAGGGAAEALVRTYAAFALAFFFRPLGAALFGTLGDRTGRRPVLIGVITLMTASTALIGLLPTYATAGAAAPWLLTLLRALQGLSAGGEFGGAVALMTESATPGRRGLYGAWQSFTVALGLLAGAGVATATATLLTPAQLAEWGWRLPFLLALPLGLVALWLRVGLDETPRAGAGEDGGPRGGAGVAAWGRGGGPPGDAGTGTRSRDGLAGGPPGGAGVGVRVVLTAVGRVMGWSAAGYTFLVVLPSYLQVALHADVRQALLATVPADLGFAAAILPAGLLSDRVGRRPVMLTGAVLVTALAVPLLRLLQDDGTSAAAKGAATAAAGAVVGLMAGPGPALLAEMFPARVRWTGLGLAYSLSNAVFSGCAGLIITEAVRRTGDADVPAYYAAAACAVSALVLARGPWRAGTRAGAPGGGRSGGASGSRRALRRGRSERCG